jgi:hypothetical protein
VFTEKSPQQPHTSYGCTLDKPNDIQILIRKQKTLQTPDSLALEKKFNEKLKRKQISKSQKSGKHTDYPKKP